MGVRCAEPSSGTALKRLLRMRSRLKLEMNLILRRTYGRASRRRRAVRILNIHHPEEPARADVAKDGPFY